MIKLSNINKIYNKGKGNEFQALYDLSLTVNDGELVGIVGKSGSGKTTLLNIIGCIDTFSSGEYTLDDISVEKCSDKRFAEIRNSKIGIVMQDYSLIETYTVKENLLVPTFFSKNKPRKSDTNKRIDELLEKLGISDLKNKDVRELSGGQKQRTAIARALMNNPSVILADEPTGALDSGTSSEIMNLFTDLNKDGKTVIIVTHDSEIASRCSRVIEISDGSIIAQSQ
ncbi:MAG: ABC transporter ATP-binding protein [Ruminococcus sp.]|nr:ABC transporter ATP-binding protein [Ruminococcus sp.]